MLYINKWNYESNQGLGTYKGSDCMIVNNQLLIGNYPNCEFTSVSINELRVAINTFEEGNK